SQFSDFLRFFEVNFLTSFFFPYSTDQELIFWHPEILRSQFSDFLLLSLFHRSRVNFLASCSPPIRSQFSDILHSFLIPPIRSQFSDFLLLSLFHRLGSGVNFL
ncbi:hypothetical protein V8G54_000773, partial [Vigna mungo]